MSVVLLLTAGLLSAPEWREPLPVGRRYPQFALRERTSAATMLELVVDPKGKAVRCETVAVVGDERLADALCDGAKSMKFEPATDAEGKPAYGLWRDLVKLFLPDAEQGRAISALTSRPDLELGAASLPCIDGDALDLRITVAVDPGGKVTDCEFEENATAIQAYGEAACQYVGSMQLDRLTGADGGPISYVRRVSVRFALDEQASATTEP